jgi:hypothetical protein
VNADFLKKCTSRNGNIVLRRFHTHCYDCLLCRIKHQTDTFVEGRQPSGAAVFYVREVIGALLAGSCLIFVLKVLFVTKASLWSLGSLTEREIKASAVEACQDLGVKYTGRGTIAGMHCFVHFRFLRPMTH